MSEPAKLSPLDVTTPELWPINAEKIIREKNISIQELEKMFTNITFPWNNKYNTERVYYSLRINQRPLFIVKPTSIAEIEKILDYVFSKKLTIRIMNGRHSSALTYSEVLVDMSFFIHKELHHDVLIAGAGNTQGMLNEFLFNKNNKEIYSHFGSFIHPRVDTEAFPGGSAASVGSAGISTVGGIGTLCRTYSLTIDSIISFKITIPPKTHRGSKTIVVSKDNHENLFWALRGGMGSNFGIISEITYKIIIVPNIIQYSVTWPWDQAVSVLNKWKKESICRPDQFNEDITLFHNPETKQSGIELAGIYVIPNMLTEEDAINEIHSQLDSLGGVLTIRSKIPYSTLYKKLVKDRVYYNFSIIQPLFMDVINSKMIVQMINNAKKLSGPAAITFTLLGGKISEVSSRQMAFYPRKKHFFVDISSFWQNIHESQSMEKWTNEIVKELINMDNTIAYVGFPITFSNIKYSNDIYYGKNYCELQRIKEFYDPHNILTFCGTIN